MWDARTSFWRMICIWAVNTLNQQTIIRNIIKQNNILHKNLNIVRVVWIKKNANQRKKFFSLIIEIISAEMINRLIKKELLDDYTHFICDYFEKKCRIKQCFKCQWYKHVNETCRNAKRCEHCTRAHATKDCRISANHRTCANCEDKHSTWSFQRDVKTKKKNRLNVIWKNKFILHIKTSRNNDEKLMNKQRTNDAKTFVNFANH